MTVTTAVPAMLPGSDDMLARELATPFDGVLEDATAPIEDDDEQPSIQDRFDAFHRENPWVYSRLRDLALDMARRGHTRIGIGMLWEVLRWQVATSTSGDQGFRLNNSLRSRYARALAENERELADVFETRALRAA